MPLVINSLGGRDTHTQIHTCTDTRTESILKDQAHAGRSAWFDNRHCSSYFCHELCIYNYTKLLLLLEA